MKFLNFFTGFFNNKGEYIGLTSFKDESEIKQETKKEKRIPEKTALTGLLKRV